MMSRPRVDVFGAISVRAISICAISLGVCALALLWAPAVIAQSTFTPMSGNWTGGGVVELRSGTQERVRCKANYATASDGQSFKLELRCASDAYKFELTSSIAQSGRDLTGIWYESTHRVGGKISGRNNGGSIEARAEGDIVTALLTVKTDGNRQSFVMEAPGAQVEQVSIDLHR